MFNIDVPRYFCLDLIETKPVFETTSALINEDEMESSFVGQRNQKTRTLPDRLKLTELEKEHDKRLTEFAF